MEPNEIIDAMTKGFASVESKLESKLETQFAELNETAKKVLTPKVEDIQSAAAVKAEAETKAADEAKLAEEAKLKEAGAVAGISGFQLWDIPVGAALLGGFVAVFASELIDGFLMKQGDMAKGIVKLAGAGVAVKWGKGLLGSTGSKAVALLLAYDGVRSLIPIDAWARRGSTTVSGMLPAGGLGGFRRNVTGNPAEDGDKSYYEALKGGR